MLRLRTTLLSICACAGLASCSSPGDPEISSPPRGEVKLGLGEARAYTGSNSAPMLTFSSVLEDSRCPRIAQCVWEGNARIRLELLHPAKASDLKPEWPRPRDSAGREAAFAVESVELNTSGRFDQQRQTSLGVIRLLRLEPAPPVADGHDYVAVLDIQHGH